MIGRGILFPGYGNQYVVMGKELYDEHRVVQEYFEEAAEILNINFVKLCFASSDADITTMPQGPLALFVIEAASSGLLRTAGISYEAAAGVDMISWYSSLYAAQAMSFPDCLYMLRKWAELYSKTATEEAHLQASAAIEVHRPEAFIMVAAWCEQLTQRNLLARVIRVTDHEIIVAGALEAMSQLQEMVQRESMAFTRRDNVEQGDILLTEESLLQLQHYLEKVDFKEPVCPVANIIRGGYSITADDLKQIATELLVQPLQVDRVYKDIELWQELIISIPSLRMKEQIATLFYGKAIWTMETSVEFEAMKSTLTSP